MGSMRTTRARRRGWLYAVAAMLVVLGVAAMHADPGVLISASHPHEAVAVARQGDGPAAAPLPGPVDPMGPTDPCHAASQACCALAQPTSAPRQWIALLAVALAVVIGATQVPVLQRASMLRPGIGWRPPPDLTALCVQRT
jgi:hypothetical protein